MNKLLGQFKVLKKQKKEVVEGLITLAENIPWQEYHDLSVLLSSKTFLCGYGLAWQEPCQTITWGAGRCDVHKHEKCAVCGQQADYQCSFAGQFVCGTPLCGSEDCREAHNKAFRH